MRFTLRQLTYFKALADHRNFGRAAAACHVSQPALSVQIRALEEMMGGRLVERAARDVFLTPFGREVLDHATAILSESDDLEKIAAERVSGQQSLAIGFIPTLAPYLLPGVLGALRAGDLSLSVQVQEAQTDQLTSRLIQGDLDAAVLALPVEHAALTATALFEDRFLLAGSTHRLGLAQSNSAVIRPRDLDERQLMLLEDGHCLTDQALDACGKDRTNPGIDMGASSLATLSRLVAAGFGLTLLPETAVETELSATRELNVLRFPDPEPFRTVALVRRASTPNDLWFKDLSDLIKEVGTTLVDGCRRRFVPPAS